jgi:UDP-glucose:(heptosyl)LPS alpha-1,3-glucosyltransferase
MKLGLVSWNLHTSHGVGRCVVELSRRLSSSYDVHVFVAEADSPPPPGVTVHRIPLHTRRHYPAEIEYLARVGAMLRRERCDLTHLHIPVRFPADVFTCHSVAPSILRCRDVSLRQRMPYLFQIPLYRYHFRNKKTWITTVSETARQEAARYYKRDPDGILVIPNGVDLDRFHPGLTREPGREARAALGIGPSRFVFLLVGSNLCLKGARFAVETMARLPEETVLLFVGSGRPEDVPDPGGILGGLIRKGRVVFARTGGEVSRYYGASDALLFPSHYESFGLVVLEAMASGIPVITSRTVAIGREAILDGENGFVVDSPRDVDGLVERAQVLIRNPELSRTIGERGRKVAMSYTWERNVSLTKAVYERVLEERRKRTQWGKAIPSGDAGRQTVR